MWFDLIRWLVALELAGLAALPLAYRLFPALPGIAPGIAKALALILIGYVAWITGMIGATAFTGPTIVVICAILAAASWLPWGRVAQRAWRANRATAIGAEVAFLLVFAVATWVRAHNAAIAGTEKPMDMTFLTSLIEANRLPAQDLWLAQFGLPYYYLGYLIYALPAKAVGLQPAVAYNLAVVTVIALSATAAFGLAAALVQRAGAGQRLALGLGAVGAFALAVMGDLEAFFEWLAGSNVGDAGFWAAMGIKNVTASAAGFPPADGGWWFKAARVIPNLQPDGITEFPNFSFLLGDLHPHYMAIPLAILIAAIAVHEVLSEQPIFGDPVRFTVAAVVFGAVIPSNTWDIPIFWGAFALASVAGVLGAREITRQMVLRRLGHLATFAVVAGGLYAPYFIGYSSQQLGLALVEGDRTMLGSLFILFGPLLVLTVLGGALASSATRLGRTALGFGVCVAVVLVAVRQPGLGVVAFGLIAWLAVFWERARADDDRIATATAVLATLGLASILIPEVVYLRDAFGSRMNTVFKFYYDAWIMLALAAPPLIYELLAVGRLVGARLAHRPAWHRETAIGVLGATAALAIAGAFYPIFATPARSGGFGGQATLDGMAFLRSSRPDDAAAIDWLRQNHPDSGVIEAVGGAYTDAGRFATFAGTPTLLGWSNHENQWRGVQPVLQQRDELARQVYMGSDASSWATAARGLGMTYVVVGDLERQIYGADVSGRIAGALQAAHQNGSTTLYAVPGTSEAVASR